MNRYSRLAWIPLLALLASTNILSVGCSVTTAALPELPPVPVLVVTARTLPTAFQSSFYPSQFISTVGGSAPLTSCTVVRVSVVAGGVVGGLLPFDPGSGIGIRVEMPTAGNPRPTQCEIFTDTPPGFVNVAPGTYRFTLRAADSSNPAISDTEDFTLVVEAGFSILTPAVEDGVMGRAYAKRISTNVGTVVVIGGNMFTQGRDPLASCVAANPLVAPPAGVTSGLPPGLMVSLDPSADPADPGQTTPTSCRITGMPTATGMFQFRVIATDTATPTANVRERTYTLVVRGDYAITPFTVVDGIINRPYSKSFSISTNLSNIASDVGQAMELGNGPISETAMGSGIFCAAAGLPAGVTVTSCTLGAGGTSVTATFAGTPTAAGTVMPTLMLSDTPIPDGSGTGTPNPTDPVVARRTASFQFAFTVRNEFSINAFTVVDGIINRPYSKTFTVATNLSVNANDVGQAAEFGNGPITTCMFSGLPAGISATVCTVDPSGTSVTVTLAGTPTTLGQVTSTVSLTDTNIFQPPQAAPVVAATTIMFNFMFTVRDDYTITPFSVVDGIRNRAYSKTFTVTTNLSVNANDVGQTAEFGNGPITACMFSNLPVGISATSCTVAAGGTSVTVTLSGTPTVIGTGAPTSITLTDTNILQPPQVAPVVAARAVSFMFNFTIREEFSITEPNLVDAVFGRPYAKNIATNLVMVNPGTDVGQGAEFGNGPIVTCMETTGNLAAVGLTVAVDPTNASRCRILGTPTSGFGTTIMITLAVTDNPIFQPPQVAAVVAAGTIMRTYSLSIRGEFDITPFTVVDGIVNRTYNKTFTVSTNLSNNPVDVGQAAEFGNGPITNCTVMGLPAGVTATSCVTNPSGTGVTLALSGTPTATGATTATIQITDSDILQNAVVVTAAATRSFMFTFTVRAEFQITEPNVVDAIFGRPYVKNLATTLVAVDPGTDVGQAAEFGNGPIFACGETSGALSGVGLTVGVDPTNASRCRIFGTPTAGAGTTIMITVAVTDNPIFQLPQATAVVPTNTITRTYMLTIRGEFSITEPFVVDGVAGRAFTKHIDTDLLAVAGASDIGQTGELGNGPPVMCAAAISGSTLPFNGFSIATETNGCRIMAANTHTLVPGTYTLDVFVTDNNILQNAVTVVAATTIRRTYTFVIRPNSTFVTTTVVDAVTTRTYTKTLVTDKTVAGGTGAGAIVTNGCAFGGGSNVPTGLGVRVATNNLDCELFTATTLTGASGSYTFTVMATDSDIIQDGVTVVAGGSFSRTYTLFVRNDFMFLTNAVVNGVAGRGYSKLVETNLLDGAGATDVNQNENGNGPASTCGISATGGAGTFAGNIMVAVTGGTISLTVSPDPAFAGSCRLTAGIPATIAAGQSASFFVNAMDMNILQLNPRTAVNETVVPGGTQATVMLTLTVRAALAIDLTASNCNSPAAGGCPLAVRDRAYTNDLMEQTGTGGDPPLFWNVRAAGNFTLVGTIWTGNAGSLCQGLTLDQTTGTFGGTPTGGAGAGAACLADIFLTDSGILQPSVNHGTFTVVPAGSTASQSFSITVNDPMTIVNASLAGGLKDNPYIVTLAVRNGLTTAGNLNLPAAIAWTETSGNLGSGACTGLMINDLNATTTDQRATITGTPTMAGDCIVTVRATDNGNAPGVGQFVPSGSVVMTFTIVINDSIGFVTNQGGPYVRVIRTDTPGVAAMPNLIPSPAGASPEGIAVHTTDPLFAYVADGASGTVSVFCTRVETPICPTAFQPPVTVPAVINQVPTIDPFVNPTDVAVNATNSAFVAAGAIRSFGLIADPNFGSAASCGGTGAIIFFDADRNSPNFNTDNVVGGGCLTGARKVAIRPQGDFAYVATNGASVGVVMIAGAPTLTALPSATVLLPAAAVSFDVAVSPDGRFAYVTDFANGVVYVIDTDPANIATTFNSVIATTPAPGAAGGLQMNAVPMFIAFAPDGRYAYLTEDGNNVIAAIDPATLDTVGGTVQVTNNNIMINVAALAPRGIALTEDSLKAFVANAASDNISVINTDLASGTFQTEVALFNGAGNFAGPFGVAVMSDPHLHILNPLPAGIIGISYDFSIAAAGGVRPYIFSVPMGPFTFVAPNFVGNPGTPCQGLTIVPATGLIFGTPAMAGNCVFTAMVTDASTPTQMSTRVLTITVVDPGNVLSADVEDAVNGRTYSKRLTAAGLPFMYQNPNGSTTSLNTMDPGNDCSGLSMNVQGLITGIAGIQGDAVCAFTVDLIGSGGMTLATRMYTLTIRQEFSVNEPFLVDGVTLRSYTKHIDTNLVMTAGADDFDETEFGNGPAAGCAATIDTVPSTGAQMLPFGGFTIAPETNGCRLLAAGGVGLAPGTYTVVVNVTDNAIPDAMSAQQVVPANMRTMMYTLVIRSEYSITSATPTPATAFNNQTYMAMFTVTTNLLSNALDVGQAAEFGNGPITACTVTGTLPAGLMAATSFAGMTSCTVTITGTPNVPVALPAMFTLMVNVADTNIQQDGVNVVTFAAASQAFMLTVDKTATTTTITMDTPDPSVFGQMYAVSVSVASNGGTNVNPIGSVTISDTFGNSCMAALTTGNPSTGSCNLPSTNVGTTDLTAMYNGDLNFYGSTSATEPHTVNKADTTTTITSDNPDPSLVNTAVTVNFTVAAVAPGAGIPTGMVTVSDGVDNCAFTLAAADNGMGTCMITLTSTGPRLLTASYVGDTHFNASDNVGTEEPHQVKAVTLATFTLGNGSVSTATVPRNYSVDIPITGTGATGCSDGGTLPAGLAVMLVAGTPDVCLIFGNPTATFSGMVTITVDDGVVPDMQSSALTITAALTINQDTGMDGTEALTPDAVSQQSYTKSFTASGGQPMFTFAETSGAMLSDDPVNCAGLTFTGGTTGSLGSTPTATGTCSFTIQVTDSDTFSIVNGTPTVTPTSPAAIYFLGNTLNIGAPLSITTTTTVNALRGSPYNPGTTAGQTLATTGGFGGSYMWSITGAALGTLFTASGGNFVGMAGTACEGLTLDGTGPTGTTGLIHGTAVNVGTCGPFTVRVSDPGDGMMVGPGMDTQSLSILVLNTFLYVADPANDQVNVINTTGDTEVTSAAAPVIPIPVGGNAHSIALRKDGLRAYVTIEDTNSLVTIDTTTNTVIDTLDLSTDPDGAGTTFASCPTLRGIAVGIAGNADNRAYVVCANTGSGTDDRVEILDISGSTPVRLATLDFPGTQAEGATEEPVGIAVSPDGSVVYIAVVNEDELFQITTNATATAEAITFTNNFFPGTGAENVAFSNDGSLAYFTSQLSDNVFVVDAATPGAAPTATIAVFPGLSPFRLTADPDTGRLFVGMSATGTLDPQNAATTTGFMAPIENNASTTSKEITVGLNNADRANCAACVTTITFVGHPFVTGDVISVFGMSVANFDGIFTVTGTTANTFTYSQTGLANNADQEGALIQLLIPAGSTAPDGLATPPTNTKVYAGISDAVSRRSDSGTFASAGANITLSGAAGSTPRGLAAIPIPR